MFKNLTIIVLGLLMIGLIGCNIKTPEIKGIVLDAETKQPVEGAWVGANVELNTKTVGGDVHSALSLDEPHTRTDKQGRFIIPSKRIKKPFPPVGFGAEVLSFRVGASTVDDKGGSVKYFGGYYKRDFGKGDGDLQKILRKDVIELTIYLKPEERTESEYFSHLQALYNYCLTGRFFVEVPAVEGGCDAWELDYVIRKHEQYLEKYKNPKIIENPPYGISKWNKIHKYSAVFKNLAYLYKKKGDYKKALILFKEVKGFDERHGSSFSVKEYESQIKELEQLLQQKQK